MDATKKSRARKTARVNKNSDNTPLRKPRTSPAQSVGPGRCTGGPPMALDLPNIKIEDKPSPEMFAHLKRSTDEIAELTTSRNPFSKRVIYSNWNQYEVPEEVEEDLTQAADFTSLLHAPISQGGHFKFKSERARDTKVLSKYSDYFSLDLKYLNTSMLSIPFHERHGLDTGVLNEIQVARMNNQAAIYQAKLQKVKRIETKPRNDGVRISEQEHVSDVERTPEVEGPPVEIIAKPPIISEITQHVVEQEIEQSKPVSTCTEIDDLLSLTTSKPIQLIFPLKLEPDPLLVDVPVEVSKPNTSTAIELEQWLDDILDD